MSNDLTLNKPTVKVLNDRNPKIFGTFLQGYIHADYMDMVNLFGEPGAGDEYKIDAEWALEFQDGTIATIYNYKDGINYNGPEGTPTAEITEWHIGGKSQRAVELVTQLLAPIQQ